MENCHLMELTLQVSMCVGGDGELLTPPVIVSCWGRERSQDGEFGRVVARKARATTGALLPGDADATDLGHTRKAAGLGGLPRAERIPTVTLHLQIPQDRVWGARVSCTGWFKG